MSFSKKFKVSKTEIPKMSDNTKCDFNFTAQISGPKNTHIRKRNNKNGYI